MFRKAAITVMTTAIVAVSAMTVTTTTASAGFYTFFDLEPEWTPFNPDAQFEECKIVEVTRYDPVTDEATTAYETQCY